MVKFSTFILFWGTGSHFDLASWTPKNVSQPQPPISLLSGSAWVVQAAKHTILHMSWLAQAQAGDLSRSNQNEAQGFVRSTRKEDCWSH